MTTDVNENTEENTEETSDETPKHAAPPPTNEERRAAKEAADKEAEEAAAKAKEAEEAGEEEGAGDEEEGSGEDKELDTSVWGEHDDVTSSVLTLMQNADATPEDAKALLWDAVEAGDPSKVDQASLVEKVGKAKAALIMAGIENVTSKNNAQIAAVTKIAEDAAGGKDNWEKARDWAKSEKSGISAADLEDYRGMLDKGGKQAEFAAKEIVSLYNANPKNTALKAGDTTITPDAKSATAVKGISRLEYGQELERLHKRKASEAEFTALSAQRTAGRKQGL